MRRRRRKSAFATRGAPQTRTILLAGAVILALGAFVFFMNQADTLAPAQREISVPLPDAFKQ